jgi:hypothetical protein
LTRSIGAVDAASVTARRIWPTLALVVVTAACGSSSSGESPNDDTGVDTGSGDAEVAPTGCAAGESMQDDGHCEAAGIPPESCGTGFTPDGRRGCTAVLPADPCPAGQVAVPGDTACHEVAPCGEGTWGTIPVDAGTQYVDASYAGAVVSDGSAAAPWKTIKDGIRAAASGAIVAVAAGSYAEDVFIGAIAGPGKPVRLWGRCPAMVEVVGSSAGMAAVRVDGGAPGTEVHALAVRGATMGVYVYGSRNVILDRLWVHDTADRGVEVDDTQGVVLQGSLVEKGNDVGVHLGGADLTIDATTVRDTLPRADRTGGRGISVEVDGSLVGNLTLRGSVLERNRDVAVFAFGTSVTIETSVIRDTQSRASDDDGGAGIAIEDGHGHRGSLTLRTSILERNHEVAVLVAGSDATIEATMVTDTQPQVSDQKVGTGIALESDPITKERTQATIRACLIASNHESGVDVEASDAILERLLVRDTLPRASDGTFGDGIVVYAVAGSTATITATRVEGSARAGIANFGGAITLGTTKLECNAIQLDGESLAGLDFSFDDTGGSACGCSGATVVCQILSSGLAPPEPISVGP